MKYSIIAATLIFSVVAAARDAGTITLTPVSPTYNPSLSLSGAVSTGDPDVWNIDLTGFPGPVTLEITLQDYYPPLPDDYDVFLNGVFVGNTLTASPGRTFKIALPPTTNQLKIAYVNAHTGFPPHPGGSGYNLRIVASLAAANPLTTGIGMYSGIRITGTVGASYRVEYSFDLTTWNKLTDIVLPSSPYIYFDLVPVDQTVKRFYRVVSVP